MTKKGKNEVLMSYNLFTTILTIEVKIVSNDLHTL
jgi:hypothetical protein